MNNSNLLWSMRPNANNIQILSTNSTSATGLTFQNSLTGQCNIALNTANGQYLGLIGKQVFPNPAQRTIVRFVTTFNTTANESFIGLCDMQDGIMFGYKNGVPTVRTYANGVPRAYFINVSSFTTGGTFTLTLNGTAASFSVTPGDVATVALAMATAFQNSSPFLASTDGNGNAKFLSIMSENFSGASSFVNGTGTATVNITLDNAGTAATIVDTTIASSVFNGIDNTKPMSIEFHLLGANIGYEVYVVRYGVRILISRQQGFLVKGGLPIHAHIKHTVSAGTLSMKISTISCFGPESIKACWSQSVSYNGFFANNIYAGMAFDLTGISRTKWNISSGKIYSIDTLMGVSRFQQMGVINAKSISSNFSSSSVISQLSIWGVAASATYSPTITVLTGDISTMSNRDASYPGLDVFSGQWFSVHGFLFGTAAFYSVGFKFIEEA